MDVEAAFLNPMLDRTFYLEWPEGMVDLGFITEDERREYCIKLKRSMYGNVDAALLWQKDFTKTVTEDMKFDLIQSKVDPCLYFKKDENGVVILMVIVYVDDTIVTGKAQWTISQRRSCKSTKDCWERSRTPTFRQHQINI